MRNESDSSDHNKSHSKAFVHVPAMSKKDPMDLGKTNSALTFYEDSEGNNTRAVGMGLKAKLSPSNTNVMAEGLMVGTTHLTSNEVLITAVGDTQPIVSSPGATKVEIFRLSRNGTF